MKRYSSLFALGFLAVSSMATAMPVYTDAYGREWLDVNDSRDRSWNDVQSVCNATSGACSGVLMQTGFGTNNVDLTGYQWATRDEVRSLFYELTGLPAGELDDYMASTQANPALGAFGTGVLNALPATVTFSSGPGTLSIISGITRDTLTVEEVGLLANVATIGHLTDADGEGLSSSLSLGTGGGRPLGMREVTSGTYLYRNVAVPEPSTLALFGAGLLAVLLPRGRRRRRQ